MGYIYKIYNDVNSNTYICATVNSLSKRYGQPKHDKFV